MIDFGLKPCPMCGGEAEVARMTQAPDSLTAVIKCTGCGLTLEWDTDIKVGVSRTGRRTVTKAGPDPIEAWNRRAMCDGCGHKTVTEHLADYPSCNDCGAKDCEYKPDPGELVRINCPLWEPMPAPETDPSDQSCRTCNHASFCRNYDHDGKPADCTNWEPREDNRA